MWFFDLPAEAEKKFSAISIRSCLLLYFHVCRDLIRKKKQLRESVCCKAELINYETLFCEGVHDMQDTKPFSSYQSAQVTPILSL